MEETVKKELTINLYQKKFIDNIIKLEVPVSKKIFLILTHPNNSISNKLDEKIKTNLEEKLNNIIKNKNDLIINITFGSYKRKGFLSFPFVDWAEVFHIFFILKTAEKIKKIFKEKITIEFTLQDYLIENFVNIKKEEIEKYKISFYQLVDFINKNYLKNKLITIKTSCFTEIFDQKKYFDFFQEEFTKLKKQLNFDQNNEKIRLMIERAKRNFNNLSDQQAFEKSLLHTAYINTQLKFDFYKDKNKIFLIFRKGFDNPNWLPFRTHSTSTVQFWVGCGCLIKNKTKVFPTIIGLKKLLKIKKIEEEKINIFKKLNNKNLDKIDIFEKV